MSSAPKFHFVPFHLSEYRILRCYHHPRLFHSLHFGGSLGLALSDVYSIKRVLMGTHGRYLLYDHRQISLLLPGSDFIFPAAGAPI